MRGPRPSAPSPDACPFFLKPLRPPPRPGLTRSAELAVAVAEPPHGSLGTHGQACGSGPGGRACPRGAECGCWNSRLLRWIPHQTTGTGSSLHTALHFPGQAPVHAHVLTHGSDKQSSWIRCCPRPSAERSPGCSRAPEALVGTRWGSSWGLCAQGGRQVPFPATGGRRGLARSQKRGCPGAGQSELAPHIGEVRACTPAGGVKAPR